ncbi:Pycsar system effector family protein [Streptomyces sp. NPDC046261]|uniref:Pycsar system effector family protein n=1 Tax=Streptomyces sp. NPDC046261 TaxID=3157200 RepID=UPI0033D62ED5
MPSAAPDEQMERGLDRALNKVSDALARSDVKGALLLGLDGGLVVLLGTLAADGSGIARVMAGAAAAVLGVAIVLLLLAVTPNLDADDQASFPYWATLTPEQVRNTVREDRRHHEVCTLSRLAHAKYKRVRAACVATGLAVLLLVATTFLTALD